MVAAPVSGTVVGRCVVDVLEVPAMGDPPDAVEIARCSRDDVDGRVGIVGPVHGSLTDPHAEPFGGHQELGVEEPLVVLDERKDLQRTLAPGWP